MSIVPRTVRQIHVTANVLNRQPPEQWTRRAVLRLPEVPLPAAAATLYRTGCRSHPAKTTSHEPISIASIRYRCKINLGRLGLLPGLSLGAGKGGNTTGEHIMLDPHQNLHTSTPLACLPRRPSAPR